MQIPDHLVEVVRDLAAAHLERAIGDVRVIEAMRCPNHVNAGEARARLRAAMDLCAHVRRQTSRVA